MPRATRRVGGYWDEPTTRAGEDAAGATAADEAEAGPGPDAPVDEPNPAFRGGAVSFSFRCAVPAEPVDRVRYVPSVCRVTKNAASFTWVAS